MKENESEKLPCNDYKVYICISDIEFGFGEKRKGGLIRVPCTNHDHTAPPPINPPNHNYDSIRKQMKECNQCNHCFELSTLTTESTEGNILYHQVGYSTCVKCGKIRKQDI